MDFMMEGEGGFDQDVERGMRDRKKIESSDLLAGLRTDHHDYARTLLAFLIDIPRLDRAVGWTVRRYMHDRNS